MSQHPGNEIHRVLHDLVSPSLCLHLSSHSPSLTPVHSRGSFCALELQASALIVPSAWGSLPQITPCGTSFHHSNATCLERPFLPVLDTVTAFLFFNYIFFPSKYYRLKSLFVYLLWQRPLNSYSILILLFSYFF